MRIYSKNIIFTLIIIFLMCGCGKEMVPPEKIGSSLYAGFDEFTSHTISDEGKNIFIQGTLQKSYTKEYDGAPYVVAEIREANNKLWTYRIGPMGLYSDEMLSGHIGEKVRCFGHFYKMLEGQPVVDSAWDSAVNFNESCIQFLKTANEAEKLKSFLSTENYISSYVDGNAEEIAYYDNKKPGTYKSTGVYEPYGDNFFYFYEDIDGGYKQSIINDGGPIDTALDNVRCNEVVASIISTLNRGDGITIYYTIDSNGYAKLFCYNNSNSLVSYNIDKIKQEASPTTTVAQKEYDLGEYGTVKFEAEIVKADKRVRYLARACSDNVDDAINVYVVLYSIYSQFDNYGIRVEVNNTTASASIYCDNGEKNVLGVELDGTSGISWLDTTRSSEEEFVKIRELILPKMNDFAEQLKVNSD